MGYRVGYTDFVFQKLNLPKEGSSGPSSLILVAGGGWVGVGVLMPGSAFVGGKATHRPGHIQLPSLLQGYKLLPDSATVTFVATGDWVNAAQKKFQLKGSFRFYHSSTDSSGSHMVLANGSHMVLANGSHIVLAKQAPETVPSVQGLSNTHASVRECLWTW